MGPEMSHFSFSRGNPVDQLSALLVATGANPLPGYETDSLVVPHRLRYVRLNRRFRVDATGHEMPSGRPKFDVRRSSGSASDPHAGPPIIRVS
ncbi:hypothetical protein MCNS_45350 [Mycobacterium conspicuum]|uniref:Uncharacterized protein n=1 Tax=Mycobacterium conspicuum TaxID=44010 RepID=A0A7I7YK46_9MYCO|nr:hypothetical protein MCNS_45350 [Mycobacterium conspicuum]